MNKDNVVLKYALAYWRSPIVYERRAPTLEHLNIYLRVASRNRKDNFLCFVNGSASTDAPSRSFLNGSIH